MKSKTFWAAAGRALAVVTVTLMIILTLAPGALAASKYKVLHRFNNTRDKPDGTLPYGRLILGADGALYGTTAWGYGDPCYWHGCGTGFRLTPNPDGSWTENIILTDLLWSSDSAAWPMAGLTFDAKGNLYGTTSGDYQCCGQVFAGKPNLDGTWTWTTAHLFAGPEGAQPYAELLVDTAGNLYGTTTGGGSYGAGVVFELTPNPDGSWTYNTLYQFTGGKDGGAPFAALIFDADGNLYGTTTGGGLAGCGGAGCGTVFKLTPAGGTWQEKVLHRFDGSKDGANPYASLTLDATGNLYSTTVTGGRYGYGVVFELTPSPTGSWKEKVLHAFKGRGDGANSYGALALDAAGNLYGTTYNGGTYGMGNVFKLTFGSDGRWTEDVLHQFRGNPGKNPYAGVTIDAAGNIFGTTVGGAGDCSNWSACGVVFEITP